MAGSSDFLRCVLSYPEAAVALGQFREVVQQRCLNIFERNIGELVAAIGYDRELEEASGFSALDRPTANATHYLGAKIVQKDGTQFQSYIYWQKNSPHLAEFSVGVAIFVWFKSGDMRLAVTNQIKEAASDPRFRRQSWEAQDTEIWLELGNNEIERFDAYLDKVFKWSIPVFQSRPRIKKLVRATFRP